MYREYTNEELLKQHRKFEEDLEREMIEKGFLCPVMGWDEWELDW